MVRSLKTLAAVLLLAASLAALAGCSAARGPLDGTRWRLAGWAVSSRPASSVTVTAQFADGRISGMCGPNTYSGPYKLGPGNAFAAGPIETPKTDGSESGPRPESAYLMLLGWVKSWKMDGGRLMLCDKGGHESLIFEPAGK